MDHAFDHAEDLAEAGDFSGAIAALAAIRARAVAEGLTNDAARAQLELGAMTARAGDLDDALPLLELAEAMATSAATPLIGLEARVTHCSVLGAMARFEDALPALRHAVAELSRLDPSGELYTQARAELRAFENVVSPKNAATWAAMMDKK